MPTFCEVTNIPANIVRGDLRRALVHALCKHFEVVLVVLQGPFRQTVNALCTQVILDPPVQIAALIVAVFDDNVVLEDCRNRLGGDWRTAQKLLRNTAVQALFLRSKARAPFDFLMYSHYTPSLKKRALYDALDRYDGRGCIFDRYGGDCVVLDRYGGDCVVLDRYGGDCSVEYSFECYCCQHNGFRRNLCEEKTHERCQRKPVRQIYYSSD